MCSPTPPTADQLVDPEWLLTELRGQLNLADMAGTLAGANVHRDCACELYLLLDRYLTGGGTPPASWLDAFRRAADEADAATAPTA